MIGCFFSSRILWKWSHMIYFCIKHHSLRMFLNFLIFYLHQYLIHFYYCVISHINEPNVFIYLFCFQWTAGHFPYWTIMSKAVILLQNFLWHMLSLFQSKPLNEFPGYSIIHIFQFKVNFQTFYAKEIAQFYTCSYNI